MASVRLDNIRKSYGAVDVIHGVNVEISDGEFVILVGPSGCGKSTLLRMIAGLEAITGGHVRIGDDIVNHVRPKDRDIAMVFQNYALYPHMTVADNMSFALALKKTSRSEINSRVKSAAEILGLTNMLGRYPKELSGGQRQRVAMGRAIVRDPKVFLFDEPLSNLDAKLRVAMRAEIKELHQRLGTTIVYVTHDQVEAMTMADKIVVMRDGLVEQIGAPLDLYERPDNLFVASFIGSPSMNFIEGRVQRENGAAVFRSSDLTVRLAGSFDFDDDQITLGIRPEHIALVNQSIEAVVHVVEPTGSETQVEARVGKKNITCLFREHLELSPGDKINLGFTPDRILLFETATGRRLDYNSVRTKRHDDRFEKAAFA